MIIIIIIFGWHLFNKITGVLYEQNKSNNGTIQRHKSDTQHSVLLDHSLYWRLGHFSDCTT